MRPGTHEVEQFGVNKIVSGDLTGGEWQPVYSLVDGRLTREAIESAMKQNQYAGLVGIFLGAKFQVANVGTARFKLSEASGASVWIDGRPVNADAVLSAQLTAGTHTIVLCFAPAKLREPVRLESNDATFLPN